MEQYKPILAKFMDHYKGTDEYTTSTVPLEVVPEERLMNMTLAELTAKKYITAEELYAVTPEDVEKWMIKRAYGIENTSFKDLPADARVLYLRTDTLEYYKKALSYFMPNQLQPWNEVLKQGNPTRSTLINNLIKGTRKKELREEGLQSKARRELDAVEYKQTILKFNSYTNDIVRRFMIPALLKFQFHMIARIDDTANFKEKDIKPHPQFRFALMAKMRWSKNLHDERSVPDQIMLGAMDKDYCILLGLAIYLEIWLERNMGMTNDYLFGHLTSAEGNRKFVSSVLKTFWKSNEFIKSRAGLIGTHSMRKYPVTFAGNTCSEHDVEVRGRWKSTGTKIIRRYMSNDLPYADAKVASTLCIGGACMYSLNDQSGITDVWLYEHVVPCIFQRSKVQGRESVAQVLALPLLWASLDDAMEPFMPLSIRNRVRAAYESIRVLPEEQNPVTKIPLLVASNHNGALRIDPITHTLPNGSNNEIDGNMAASIINSNNALFSHFMVNQQEVRELRLQQQQYISTLQGFERRLIEIVNAQTNIVNRNIRRLAIQPTRRILPAPPNVPLANPVGAPLPIPGVVGDPPMPAPAQDPPAHVHPARPATLSEKPKNLYELWDEYMTGIGGRLPAKDFDPIQRGREKYKYHRRKVVWDQILKMVNLGYTSDSAIDAIYAKYGPNRSVSEIINKMRKDRMTAEGIVV